MIWCSADVSVSVAVDEILEENVVVVIPYRNVLRMRDLKKTTLNMMVV